MQPTTTRSGSRRWLRRLCVTVALVALVPIVSTSTASAASARVVQEGESIQAAIDAAPPGTEIRVRGDHVEQVWINKDGITLKGLDGASITLPEDAEPGPCRFPVAVCAIPEAAISAFPDFQRPFEYLRNVAVRDLTINAPTGDGVGAIFTRGVDVRNTEFGDVACNGVFTFVSSGVSVVGNTVDSSAFCDGIAVIGAERARVADNSVSNSAFAGITVQDSSNVKIQDNTATGNCIGIVAFDSEGPAPAVGFQITGNTTNANNSICVPFGPDIPIGATGILGAAVDGLVIKNNTANDNVTDQVSITAGGISVQDSPDGTMADNVLVSRNVATGNSSAAGPLDLNIFTAGRLQAVKKNNCDVSLSDPSWCATAPIDASEGIPVGRAAPTNGLNGLYVSPVDGNVYIASVGGDEITVHHPQSGAVLDRLGPERGVNGPDDVFITDDGTVYWTEILTGFVGMLKTDGTFVRQFVGPGVNPITMSDDGRLFVNRLFLGQGLYELDPNLVEPPVLLNGDLALNSFDFGPDGEFYAPSFFTGEVLRVDVDSAIPVDVEVVANVGGPSSAVKFNSAGEAHAVNIGAGIVLKLDLSGADDHEVVLDVEGTIDNIAFNDDDALFVAVGADNQIVRVNANGRTRTIARGGLGLPGDVAVSPDGTVWVTELFALRGFTDRTNPTTSFYDRFLPPGTGFAGATSVAADGDDLIITSGFANSFQMLDPVTGDVSLDIRTLAAPTNALRHDGDVVATQVGVGNVVNAEDPTEVLLDGLAVPLGLASDGDTLYVGDWALGDIWAVDDAGATLLASGLVLPEGMAVDGDRLLVVETGLQQVTAIDLATGATSPAIVGLDYSDRVPAGFFPFGVMSGVAVGANNSIYVSDDGVNNVFEFRR